MSAKVLNTAAAALCAALLASCGDTSISENEARLAGLLDGGIDGNIRATEEDRFARLSEGNAVARDIIAAYDNDPAVSGQGASLQALLNNALSRNAEIARAAQQINRADAERLNAIFGYLPQVTFTLNSNQIDQEVVSSDNQVFNAGVASYGSQDMTFEISQPIVDMSRIFGIRIARTVRTRAEVDYIATVQRVMYEVFDTYLQAVQADAYVTSLRQRETVLRRQLSAERTRISEGLSRPTTSRAIEIELADLGVETARLSLDRSERLSALSFLTGTRVEGVSRADIPTGVVGTERRISVPAAINDAMERNPVVLRSLIAVTEADMRHKQARLADFSPVLVAFARMVDEEREGSRFGGGSVTSDTIIGVRLVVPIFNARGEGYQNIESRVDLKDALVQYLNERRRLETDIASTHQRMVDLTTAKARAQAAVRANRALVRQEQDLVEAGESQPYVVATFQSSAIEAQAEATELDLQYLRAWARFAYLTGQNLGRR